MHKVRARQSGAQISAASPHSGRDSTLTAAAAAAAAPAACDLGSIGVGQPPGWQKWFSMQVLPRFLHFSYSEEFQNELYY